MVSSTLPAPSGPSLPLSPTLDEILAPHHAINPPANITRIPTDAERRAACATGTRPPAPSRGPFAPFRPDAQALETILSQLISSIHSLDSIAACHNTSVGALTLWMSRPDVQPILDQLESGCYRHARLAAAHELPKAVNALSLILSCASEAEASIPIPREPRGIILRERSRTNTRKAAWLLYRISRSHPSIPIDPATRLKLEQIRLERAQQRAANRILSPVLTHSPERTSSPMSAPAPMNAQATARVAPIPSEPIAPERDEEPLPAKAPAPSPSSPSPSLRSTPSQPLVSPSVALRDLRGEASSLSPPEPLDDHHATLIPCGITLDSS
jgi:hypothetical protein